jgi:TPR repeat protein
MILKRKVVLLALFVFSFKGTSFMCEPLDNSDTGSSDLYADPSKNNNIIRLNQAYLISDNEIPQKEIDALNGDPDAAFCLALHYGYGMNDIDKNFKWLTIGAENGHLESIYGLTVFINTINDYRLYVRGIFWLYQLARRGYRETEARLIKLGYSLDTATPPVDSLFCDNYAQFTKTELEQCENGALKGSNKAAFLLGKYYGEIQGDINLSKYWYRIGAQNGSPECQNILGQMLSGDENEFDQIRGKFWLKRANYNGVDHSDN